MDTVLSSWDLNGQLLWQKNYPVAGDKPESIHVFQTGLLLTLGEQAAGGANIPVFEYLDFSGQQVWRMPVASSGYAQRVDQYPGRTEIVIAEELREASPSFYLLRAYFGDGSFPGLHSELQKFDLRGGSEIWHVDLNVDPQQNSRALILPSRAINGTTGIPSSTLNPVSI